MCELKSARFNNVVVNQNSSSEEVTQRNKMVAGGLIFEQDRGVLKVDVAYQTSRSVTENFNAEVGRSAERRVGKACVSTCRSRWSPYHSKKKITVNYYLANTRHIFIENSNTNAELEIQPLI